MTTETTKERRARERLQRLCRFEEVLRYAAVDPGLRELPESLRAIDREDLAKMLGIYKGGDDKTRKSVLGDLAVVIHVTQAAQMWEELRAGRIIGAFGELQSTLDQAQRALAQFAPATPPKARPWSAMKARQKDRVARYFMTTVFEEHETRRRIASHDQDIAKNGRLRPLKEAPFFDVARHAVAANMARRWYSIAGVVPHNLSVEELVDIGCCPPLPDFCENLEESMRPYRGASERLRALVEPFDTNSIETLRAQIAELLSTVEAARQAYRGSAEDNIICATIRRTDALALACATLYAKRFGREQVTLGLNDPFADFVRMVDFALRGETGWRFPKAVVSLVLKGHESGQLALDAFDPPEPRSWEFEHLRKVRPPSHTKASGVSSEAAVPSTRNRSARG